MAYADFYNLNEHILYPFVPTADGRIPFAVSGYLPNSAVADLGFTIGVSASFDPTDGNVYLYSIDRYGSSLAFTFKAVSDGSMVSAFVFVFENTDPAGTVKYSEAAGGPLYGVGFMVAGDLVNLYATIGSDGEHLLQPVGDVSSAVVEPALVVSQKKHSVASLSIGNTLRLTDQPCTGCGSPTPVDTTTVRLQPGAAQVVKNLVLKAGYNIAVSVNAADSSVLLSAVVGEGMGEACDTPISRYAGDDPEAGDRCRGIIYTINGIAPSDNGASQLEGAGNVWIQPGVVIGQLTVESRIGETSVCP